MNNISQNNDNAQMINLKKWFMEHPEFAESKNPPTTNINEQSEWLCQVCFMIFTSKKQAKRHLKEEKNHNLASSKAAHSYYNNKLNLVPIGVPNNCVYTPKFLENVIPSRKPCFTNSWQSKSETSKACDNSVKGSGDSILKTVLNSEKKKFSLSDLSVFRTPTGKYYCQSCNTTLSSHIQFSQHRESRKHRYNASKVSFN